MCLPKGQGMWWQLVPVEEDHRAELKGTNYVRNLKDVPPYLQVIMVEFMEGIPGEVKLEALPKEV